MERDSCELSISPEPALESRPPRFSPPFASKPFLLSYQANASAARGQKFSATPISCLRMGPKPQISALDWVCTRLKIERQRGKLLNQLRLRESYRAVQLSRGRSTEISCVR